MNLPVDDYLHRYLGKLAWLGRGLTALFLSGCVMTAFLSHWSLLDGAPRNSLQLYLDNQAHRPFAYRMLAPALLRTADTALPASIQGFLADQIAPEFRRNYVEPLMAQYEVMLPGITARADLDWEHASYRRSYVLMVMLMFGSFAGAMLLLRRAARTLGANAACADAVMLLYAVIVPTMFLNGGYFYDFIEQLCAAALIACVLEARWVLALATLLLMQANKETAFLMVFFLAPHLWHTMRWRMLPRVLLALSCCLIMLWWSRWAYAHLPGQPTEWHLKENLLFWSRASSWSLTEDFHSLGIALPRMTYLFFASAVLAWSWKKGATPMVLGASLAFLVLAALLMTMGYQDEFRNLSLATPLLVLLVGEQLARARPQVA